MRCSIKGCPGEYEARLVDHVERRDGKPIVVTDVPALVCNVCGDTLFDVATVKAIDAIVKNPPRSTDFAPLFKFRAVA
ncbi:MAG: YgiT-type zinc finger protein [Chloroherpetonaceae bacterium]|nr:YgiT-type zinc finger protein [Chloroherpetonaceae bacterium]MDW8019530.1 YgiT-type zinc finger protein [Chloroherpetonaceae bacterium]MDW8464626.1 YgiT-type zinc finger protein [Chloroherpetonaceae bacterium]